MGLALLTWRDEVYRLPLGGFQSDQPRMGMTLLGCFSILSFEINKIKFINSYETKMGLELLSL